MPTEIKNYSNIAILLHWLIAILILGQLAGGIIMHNLPGSELKFSLYQWHKSFGILVLLLSPLRLVWRLTHPAPPLPAYLSGFEQFFARFTHWGFYFLMIAVPIAGWMMVSASSLRIPTLLFGVIPWPDFPFVSRSEASSALFPSLHKWMAFSFIGLLTLHVLAAFKHHFKDKDDILTRMLPFLKPKA